LDSLYNSEVNQLLAFVYYYFFFLQSISLLCKSVDSLKMDTLACTICKSWYTLDWSYITVDIGTKSKAAQSLVLIDNSQIDCLRGKRHCIGLILINNPDLTSVARTHTDIYPRIIFRNAIMATHPICRVEFDKSILIIKDLFASRCICIIQASLILQLHILSP
jgi:hypothetical protein